MSCTSGVNEPSGPESKTTRMFRRVQQVAAPVGRVMCGRIRQVAAPGRSCCLLWQALKEWVHPDLLKFKCSSLISVC